MSLLLLPEPPWLVRLPWALLSFLLSHSSSSSLTDHFQDSEDKTGTFFHGLL